MSILLNITIFNFHVKYQIPEQLIKDKDYLLFLLEDMLQRSNANDRYSSAEKLRELISFYQYNHCE